MLDSPYDVLPSVLGFKWASREDLSDFSERSKGYSLSRKGIHPFWSASKQGCPSGHLWSEKAVVSSLEPISPSSCTHDSLQEHHISRIEMSRCYPPKDPTLHETECYF